MNSICTCTTLILTSFFCYSQQPSNVLTTQFKTISDARSGAKILEYSGVHSQLAIAQLTDHLSENIDYPDVMIDYGIKGRVVVEVTISVDGTIKHSRIVKSLSPAFDTAVLKAMDSFDAIAIKEKKYEGANKVYIPINFSITH